MSLPLNQVLCGDCCQLLKSIPDNSIDVVVTDPPYAISFMGKNWDKQLPPKEAFQEMFRVLKDGALAFVMSSPRQDVMWRMLKLLEDCGFEMRQSFISWVYASGFPKAADINKWIGIDIESEYCKIAVARALPNIYDDLIQVEREINKPAWVHKKIWLRDVVEQAEAMTTNPIVEMKA